jgi:hypothetical protein
MLFAANVDIEHCLVLHKYKISIQLEKDRSIEFRSKINVIPGKRIHKIAIPE